MFFKGFAGEILIAVAFATAAGAGETSSTTAPAVSMPVAGSALPKKDPNRMVCEAIEETGTRLSSRKVCMTAAEWTEQRRLDRALVEHIQAGSCVANAGC